MSAAFKTVGYDRATFMECAGVPEAANAKTPEAAVRLMRYDKALWTELCRWSPPRVRSRQSRAVFLIPIDPGVRYHFVRSGTPRSGVRVMSETNSSDSIPAGGRKNFSSSAKLKRAELRQHARFRIEDAKTEIYLKGFLAKLGFRRQNEARVAVNLSEGGILVSTLGKLVPGTRVQLRIEMEKFKDVIETEGEVRWCYMSARDASDYYTGIQFLKLAPAHLSKINQMRAWFTSPEFKQKSATRRRLADPELMK